jgi:hypothetical protein
MAVTRTTTFRVRDGLVVAGNDALLHYCELPDGRGGVYRDLLRTCELPDGWWSFDTSSGVTRAGPHDLVKFQNFGDLPNASRTPARHGSP